MNEPQLPLFDWVTTVMSEGYRKLAAFQFDEAEEHFRDVHQADQGGEEEVDKALSASSFWRSLVEQNRENPDTFSADKIYEELRRYEFGNMPGLLQLKKALLEYIADCLISGDRFYIHINGRGSETVTDLLMELRQYKKAEKLILHRIEHHPDDVQIRYSLAQIQWLSKQQGEARKNYARALLHDPCQVPLHRILYQQLNNLIEGVGTEMAPAYGWVRGVLPLVLNRQEVTYCSGTHRRAVDCYRLLYQADKALKKNDLDSCVEHRKNLKAEAPELYDEYFALLTKRHK